ncbi:hypothetical protein RA267_27455, partial [Pseudomonas syringae pv. tagetis]|uniref:hypothetical protein n=1 Tax=Pseudomonas syringae group genomosp. 7 TaxID=251699 RepID=UPI00376F6D82
MFDCFVVVGWECGFWGFGVWLVCGVGGWGREVGWLGGSWGVGGGWVCVLLVVFGGVLGDGVVWGVGFVGLG